MLGQRVRFGPPWAFVRTAVPWGVFVLAVGLTVAAATGPVWMTGLVILSAAVAVGAATGTLERTVVRQAVVVLVAGLIAVPFVRRLVPSHLTPQVIGWLAPSILATAAFVLRPAGFLDRLRNSRWAVAVFGVVVPFVAVELRANRNVGIYDTLPVVATVVQVHETGTRDLSGYTESPRFWRWAAYPKGTPLYFAAPVPGRDGLYSCYPAGMEAFAWPVVAVAGRLGVDLFDEWNQLRLERVTAAVVAGLSLGLFYLITLRFGPPAAAYLTTLLLATGSVFASSLGMLLWQQGGTVFWALVVLLVETRAGRPTRVGTLVQGVACGMLFACRPSAVTFLVPFGLWVLARDRRRGLALPLLAGLAYLPWAWLYASVYGTLLGPSMKLTGEFRYPLQHLPDVLFSPGRGLFVYQPWAGLLALYAVPAVRRAAFFPTPGFLPFAAGAVGLHLLLIGSWPMWWGGHCYGSRLLAEVVPLLGLLAVRPVGWLLGVRAGWAVVAAVGLLGLAAHLPCQFGDAWTWNVLPTDVDADPGRLWDWSRPPFRHDG